MPVPAQLPPPVAAFADRDAELARLDVILDGQEGHDVSAVTISVITGTAGVGKTALAVHWAHRVAARFPGGQLYVDLRGFGPAGAALDPGQALRGFFEAFAVPPARRVGAGRAAREPGAVDEIIAGCARLPLALTIAAARRHQPRVPPRRLRRRPARDGPRARPVRRR